MVKSSRRQNATRASSTSGASGSREGVRHDDQELTHSFLEMIASEAPCDERRDNATQAFELLQLTVVQCFGAHYSLQLQGSYEQRTPLHCSDLDIVIVGPGSAAWSKRERRETLQDLCDWIRQNCKKEGIRIAQTIYGANVPVVRLHWRPKNKNLKGPRRRTEELPPLVLDISVGDPSRGVCDANVRKLLASDTNNGLAMCLCRMIKAWAKVNPSVCHTHQGGLSSFGWVLLTIFFLQRKGLLPSLEQIDENSMRSSREPPMSRNQILQLGRSVSGDKILDLLVEIFKFFKSIPLHHQSTISVASGSRKPGHLGCVDGWDSVPVLSVEVPSPHATGKQHGALHVPENAARCLKSKIWRGKIMPLLCQAHADLSRAQLTRRNWRNGDRSKSYGVAPLRKLFSRYPNAKSVEEKFGEQNFRVLSEMRFLCKIRVVIWDFGRVSRFFTEIWREFWF